MPNLLTVLLVIAFVLSLAALLVREYIVPLVLGTVIVLAIAVIIQIGGK